MDCDGSFDPGELPRVVQPILDGDAGLCLGTCQTAQRGAWPLHARVANKVLAVFIRRRVGVNVTDIGPMRAARRVDLLDLGINDRRFGYPLEMVLRAARHEWDVVEVPVSYMPRIGSSKVTGTVRGTARAIRDMTAVLRELT